MKHRPTIDLPLVLTLATVIGIVVAAGGRWLPGAGAWQFPGLVLVYLAGGLPTGWRAFSALWRKHVLEIDLLMISPSTRPAR